MSVEMQERKMNGVGYIVWDTSVRNLNGQKRRLYQWRKETDRLWVRMKDGMVEGGCCAENTI